MKDVHLRTEQAFTGGADGNVSRRRVGAMSSTCSSHTAKSEMFFDRLLYCYTYGMNILLSRILGALVKP
jgi:hypothetical protein